MFLIGLLLFIGSMSLIIIFNSTSFILALLALAGLSAMITPFSGGSSSNTYNSTRKDLRDYERYSYLASREEATGRDSTWNRNLADRSFARIVSHK